MEDLEGEGLFYDQIEGVGRHRQGDIYRLHWSRCRGSLTRGASHAEGGRK